MYKVFRGKNSFRSSGQPSTMKDCYYISTIASRCIITFCIVTKCVISFCFANRSTVVSRPNAMKVPKSRLSTIYVSIGEHRHQKCNIPPAGIQQTGLKPACFQPCGFPLHCFCHLDFSGCLYTEVPQVRTCSAIICKKSKHPVPKMALAPTSLMGIGKGTWRPHHFH